MYGLLAEFADAADLLDATRRTRDAGYRKFDAFSPFAIEGMTELLDDSTVNISYFVLGGGFIGMLLGFGMQYWSAVINYPINVGGRPLDSVPAFVPISFEMFVLFGAFSGVFGMLFLNRLPMPYHPAFNVPDFKEVTRDRFFLSIEARDPKFDSAATRQFLESLNPLEVSNVAE